jgi:hypothetical protein
MNPRICRLAALLVALSISRQASAVTNTYPNRAAWGAAAGAAVTEDFESIPLVIVPQAGGVIATPNFNIVIDANHGDVGIVSSGFINGSNEFNGDVHGDSDPRFNTFQFNQPVTSFAADLGLVDEGGLLEVSIAGSTFAISNSADFFGMTSTVPFTQVDIRTTGSIAEFYSADNISFTLVPEPAAGAIAALLACALPVYRRRRRNP